MTTALLIMGMIGCTVVANLLMKLGASDQNSDILLGFMSWRTFTGLSAFASAAVLYSIVLKTLPLNLAQAYAAAQFIAVICAASFLLGEPITITRWVGIACIALGIAIVASTSQA